MLSYDPANRISAREALNHVNFFLGNSLTNILALFRRFGQILVCKAYLKKIFIFILFTPLSITM